MYEEERRGRIYVVGPPHQEAQGLYVTTSHEKALQHAISALTLSPMQVIIDVRSASDELWFIALTHHKRWYTYDGANLLPSVLCRLHPSYSGRVPGTSASTPLCECPLVLAQHPDYERYWTHNYLNEHYPSNTRRY